MGHEGPGFFSESSLEDKRLVTLSVHHCRESRGDSKVFFFIILFSENLR